MRRRSIKAGPWEDCKRLQLPRAFLGKAHRGTLFGLARAGVLGPLALVVDFERVAAGLSIH